MSEIPTEAYIAAMRACRDAIADLDMEYTVHKPVQGLGAPKVLACRVLDAAAPLIRQATADEIAAEIKAEMESYFAGLFDPALDEAADRAVEIARRVGGGGGGGQ
jgi:hypothetical protein